jgi:SNF2 family DNA or RNA helicase
LRDHLPHNVREMLETGDFDGAYRIMLQRARGHDTTEAPVEEENHQDISERKPLHDLVMERYRMEMRDLLSRKQRLIENGMNTAIIEETIKGHEHKMKALEDRLKAAEQETVECPICCDEMERGEMTITKCCNNAFCKSCISAVFKTNKTCPLCRKKISPMDIYSMQGDGTALDMDFTKLRVQEVRSDSLPTSPMQALLQVVSSNPKGKFVVFAPYEGSSKAFKEYFKNTSFQIADLGGSAASIRSRLDSFEGGSVNVLFLSSRTSNAGLNLQFATDVVIIDTNAELNIEDEGYKQSIGRVRRFPRTTAVPVHHISPYFQ